MTVTEQPRTRPTSPPQGAPRRRLLRGHLFALINVPTAAVLTLMVLLPLLVLVWYSFTPDITRLTDLSTETYRKIFGRSFYLKLYGKTFVTAGIAAVITVLVAWPAAWALSRIRSSWRNVILGLVIVPYLTSYLLLIYSIFVVAGPGSPIIWLLSKIGIVPADASLVYTQGATVLMLAYENIAIALFVIFAVSQRVEQAQLQAAASLGAGPLRRFRHIIAPLSVPGLIGAFILVFVPMGGAFVEPQILGGPNGSLIGNIIDDQLNTVDDPSMAAALSILLLLGILIIVSLVSALRFVIRGAR